MNTSQTENRCSRRSLCTDAFVRTHAEKQTDGPQSSLSENGSVVLMTAEGPMDSCMRALSQRPWAVGFEVFAVERSSTRRRDAETQRRRAENSAGGGPGPPLPGPPGTSGGKQLLRQKQMREREREERSATRARRVSRSEAPASRPRPWSRCPRKATCIRESARLCKLRPS